LSWTPADRRGIMPAMPTFQDVLQARLSRRSLLTSGLAAAGLGWLGRTAWAQGPLGFAAVPLSSADTLVVPPGYVAEVLYAWGDPISDGPAFKPDASNGVEDQLRQAGMHHDGMRFFPLPVGQTGSTHGLLAINHEYTDDGLLHPDGMLTWTAEKVRKSQAAHGVSVIEVRLDGGRWSVVRPSRYARRITAATPMTLNGPAAGHPWMQTAADPAGRTALGTMSNCAMGYTPWGTYLTCEENVQFYFVNRSGSLPELQRRYDFTDRGGGYRWHEFDERFDAGRHPNEPNRFGWVVEIDPFDPSRPPVKRTAMGRFKHEGAALAVAADRRVVFYMGDDERFEYVYKFVSRDPYTPGDRAASSKVLEHGRLYAARFDPDGTGVWLELAPGLNGLDAAAGFPTQAEVCIAARRAGDVAGATRMDRPEWIAVHPQTGEAYCALSYGEARGRAGHPGPGPANPRADNVYGHIVRWRELGGDPTATRFQWDVFILCGDSASADPSRRGDIKGDVFGSPDGLWVDGRGVLWIQTDVSTRLIGKGDYAAMGNNQMLAADPVTRQVRRFLTGPRGCEITGATGTPDGRTLFVNVQHPGEPPSGRSHPGNPKAFGAWPDGASGGRPRSATVVIRRADGGLIGA
jgi:secreted PhoX family phosphatase